MSEKLLKWIIYVAGAACLYGFISIRSLPVMNAILVEKMIPEHFDFVKYGELYYFNYISHFKEKLPKAERKYRFSEKHPEVHQADILMFGDSFLDISRQTTLPERLNDSIGERVYYHRFLSPHQSNPLCILAEKEYNNSNPKYIIYESVERNIPLRFDEPYKADACEEEETGKFKKVTDEVINLIFPDNSDEMYKQVLKRSAFTTKIYGFIATLKFDLFGYISSQTPVYKVADEPWLFYYPQVNDKPGSFYYAYREEDINTYCDHIALLKKELKEIYNLEMIFLPIPSKYTIYHKVVNDDPYNDFLPRLFAGLEERNVSYIDLYSEFINHEKKLYYGTDTHWKKEGVDIALSKLVEQLNLSAGGHHISLASKMKP